MSLNARESCLSGDSAKTNDNVAYRAEVFYNKLFSQKSYKYFLFD